MRQRAEGRVDVELNQWARRVVPFRLFLSSARAHVASEWGDRKHTGEHVLTLCDLSRFPVRPSAASARGTRSSEGQSTTDEAESSASGVSRGRRGHEQEGKVSKG